MSLSAGRSTVMVCVLTALVAVRAVAAEGAPDAQGASPNSAASTDAGSGGGSSTGVGGDLDVVTRSATRVMCWPRDTLQAFIAHRPAVALALERSVGFELQRILDTTLTKLSPST